MVEYIILVRNINISDVTMLMQYKQHSSEDMLTLAVFKNILIVSLWCLQVAII